jgi:hypothetical protein
MSLYGSSSKDKPVLRIVAIAVVALALVAAQEDAWARGKSGAGHRGGARSSASGHHSHPLHRPRIFLFGAAPLLYPRPYYAYPYALPYSPVPPVYVEQYPGTPTPGTTELIFCPSRGAYYPDATECPGGWQRVIPSS